MTIADTITMGIRHSSIPRVSRKSCGVRLKASIVRSYAYYDPVPVSFLRVLFLRISSHPQVRTQEHVPARRYRSNRRVLRAKRVCSSATRVARRPLTAHLREAYRCLRRRYATWLARTRGIASEQKSPRHRDSPNEAQSTLSHQRHTWSPEKVLSPYVRLGRALLARPFASCLVQDFLPDHRLTHDRS